MRLITDSPLPPPVDLDDLLAPFGPRGVDLGLERMRLLLAALGNPQARVPVVHVAGSNGKGSVCALVAQTLQRAGHRTGWYSSPHLVSWCERFRIDGEAIAPSELRPLLQRVIAAIPPGQPPTVFELVTAAAWLWLAEQRVDVAVLEVGLGGRLDATNVCDRPLTTAIVSLSLEHKEVLGNTLAAIAAEKAGILKPGCPAVIGPLPEEAATVVQRQADGLGVPLRWVAPAECQGDALVADGLLFRLGLPGDFQHSNAAVALGLLRDLQQQGWQIPNAMIQEAFAQTRWPGRLQWATWDGQPLLIDGAHNPGAALELRRYVDGRFPAQSRHWVIGMLANKEYAEVLRLLLAPSDRLWAVPVPGHPAADPAELVAIAESLGAAGAIAATPEQAFASAYVGGAPVILSGSLYLIGDFLGRHPQTR